VACGDKTLAQDSKTCMSIRGYKVARQKPQLDTAFETATRRASQPFGHIVDHKIMPTKRSVVAVIDDNLGILGAMSRLLSQLGYHTELYVSPKEFLDVALMTEARCLIVDIQLGESCGIEFAQHLANAGFTIPIIFMSANNNELVKRRAMAIGCVAFLLKPFSANALKEALAKLSCGRSALNFTA
jgi:CheY-like chemotaxis protein